MANSWQTIKLGEVLTERRETPSPESIEAGEVSIVSKIGFNAGKIELRNETKTKTGMILIRPGDLVISGINAVKGAIAIYSETAQKPVAATIHYGAYTPNKEQVDIKFLWWFLRSTAFRDIVQHHIPGGIKTELKAKRFLAVPIPLPPLTEQRRIVARIEALAARVTQAQSLRREASEETEFLFYKTTQEAFSEYSDKMTKIGNAFRVTTGGTPSRANPSYWEGNVKWVSSGEVAFSRIKDTKEKITELGVSESNAKVYPPNTVLIAMIGQGKTRGQCAILDCYAGTNQNVAGIHVYKTEHLPEYVYWWLRSRYFESRLSEIGTAQPALSGERVKQMPIPLPPLEEQRRLVAYLDGLQAQVSALRAAQAESGRALAALLPSVLDRAFKGEL